MKLWHWLIVAVVAYEGLVGLAELFTLSSTSNPLAALIGWPSLGSFVQTSSSTSTAVAGGIDLTTAIVLYFFVLHRRLVA
jgi:hypothetical protein